MLNYQAGSSIYFSESESPDLIQEDGHGRPGRDHPGVAWHQEFPWTSMCSLATHSPWPATASYAKLRPKQTRAVVFFFSKCTMYIKKCR